jgi:hypothetical protein
MTYIYILKLKYGKYYIGKTNNPNIRLNDHFNSSGSRWTKKYKPIKVEKVIPNCDDYDENKYTLQYMEKYGIDNVRGGCYCKIKLSNAEIEQIEHQLDSTNDRCYNCGERGHFANNCEYESESSEDELFCFPPKICFRCKRPGHYSTNCYARRDIFGKFLYN